MNFELLLSECETDFTIKKINFKVDLKRLQLMSVSDRKDTLSIIDEKMYRSIEDLTPRNLIILSKDFSIKDNDKINNLIILDPSIDIYALHLELSVIFDRYRDFYNQLLYLIAMEKELNQVVELIRVFVNSKCCILNANKKLIFNIYNFTSVEKIYPMEINKGSYKSLFAYFAFEDIDDKYDEEVKKIIQTISKYTYENIKNLLSNKDSFYETLKNLMVYNFTSKDQNNLTSIGWKIKDHYTVQIIKLKGGLYKYQEMIVQGNKFALDHPMYLYSIIRDNNLVLLMNNKNKGLNSINQSIQHFIEKHDLHFVMCQTNDLLNFGKIYDLSAWVLDNEIRINGDLSQNISDLIYDTFAIHPFVDVLITKKLNILKEDDKRNNTHLLKTLYYYLLEERSLMKASQRLNVHRNSIVYRINKISELVDLNLDDYKSRQNILSALEIMARIDNQVHIIEEAPIEP